MAVRIVQIIFVLNLNINFFYPIIRTQLKNIINSCILEDELGEEN